MPASTVRASVVIKKRHIKKIRRQEQFAIAEFFEPEPEMECKNSIFNPKRGNGKPPTSKSVDGFRLVVHTQVEENYGAHDWDGTGKLRQYWKPKGGNEYHLATKLTQSECSAENAAELIEKFREEIESFGNHYQEYIIGWRYYGDEPTQAERMTRDFGHDVEDCEHITVLCPKLQKEIAWRKHEAWKQQNQALEEYLQGCVEDNGHQITDSEAQCLMNNLDKDYDDVESTQDQASTTAPNS